MGERGGDVEEGLGGQGALDPPLASPQNPSVLLITSRTHLPPVSVHLICKLCSHTGLDQMRGCRMLLENSILIFALRSSGVQAWKNVYILIYCSYLICNLKWNQGNPVGRQAVGICAQGIHYLRQHQHHLYHPHATSLKRSKPTQMWPL